MTCKMVGYFRVSTKKQSDSGLGLAAQEMDVRRHVDANGCDLLATYTEVETGKKHDLDNRPALLKAIAHTKRSKAVLVVAKLDRLLRSTVVRSMLKTSGVSFVACDNPHANEFTIDILAAVAEEEVRQISKRTRAALAGLKREGVKLGSHRPECANNLKPDAAQRGRAKGAERKRTLADEAYADLAEMLKTSRAAGLSLRAIATELNAQGETTRTGRPWSATQIKRVLDRFSIRPVSV